MKIRGARTSDITALVRHGRNFWDHTRYGKVDARPYNPETVRRMCEFLINEDGGDILVLDDGDDIIGFILMQYYPLVWDWDLKCAGELAWYLDPDYRDGKLGIKLLKQAETLAMVRGCDYIAMVDMTHSMDLGPLYERLGYVKTETTYTKEL